MLMVTVNCHWFELTVPESESMNTIAAKWRELIGEDQYKYYEKYKETNAAIDDPSPIDMIFVDEFRAPIATVRMSQRVSMPARGVVASRPEGGPCPRVISP